MGSPHFHLTSKQKLVADTAVECQIVEKKCSLSQYEHVR